MRLAQESKPIPSRDSPVQKCKAFFQRFICPKNRSLTYKNEGPSKNSFFPLLFTESFDLFQDKLWSLNQM